LGADLQLDCSPILSERQPLGLPVAPVASVTGKTPPHLPPTGRGGQPFRAIVGGVCADGADHRSSGLACAV